MTAGFRSTKTAWGKSFPDCLAEGGVEGILSAPQYLVHGHGAMGGLGVLLQAVELPVPAGMLICILAWPTD